jgi:hypothetical protein
MDIGLSEVFMTLHQAVYSLPPRKYPYSESLRDIVANRPAGGFTNWTPGGYISTLGRAFP